jgi:predicted nucleic acid-binding Zn ribbon protein
MIYTYSCPECLEEKDVMHSMDECDNPSEKTILSTTCNENTCSTPPHKNAVLGTQWRRVIQCPNILTYGSGDLMKGGTLSKEEKSSRLKARANKTANEGKSLEVKKYQQEDFNIKVKKMMKGE